MITVTGNNPLKFSIIISDYESSEFIDVDCFAFEAVLEGPDLNTVFERTGKAFPFPDDSFIFTTLYQEKMIFELFEDTCEK